LHLVVAIFVINDAIKSEELSKFMKMFLYVKSLIKTTNPKAVQDWPQIGGYRLDGTAGAYIPALREDLT